MPDDDTPASTKLEDAELNLLPDLPPPTLSFRSKKRNRVMQSCVACHSQKRKCDRKRPCTRCTEHGISGQCVYQLEDPAVSRDRTEQDELLRLRSRVAELEKTVRVLMQKPLSKRQAASLDEAILGATGKRKSLDRDDDESDGRDRKLPKSSSGLPANDDPPEWLPFPDVTQPSPLSATSPAFSPFSNTAVSPADVRFPHSFMSFGEGFTPDVPTPPYSTFPTPSSDAGSPFKHPGDANMHRRFSEGSALANMMSHTSMVSPAAMSAASPAASPAAPINFHPQHPPHPHHPHPPPTPASACGCGMNPIGSEVYSGLQPNLEAAFEVLKSLPDHAQGTPCALILALADLLDNIVMASQSTAGPMLANTPPQPPPPTIGSGSQSSQQQSQPMMNNSPYLEQLSAGSSPAHAHASPAPDQLSAPSPHVTNMASNPPPSNNYHLHNPVQSQNPFHHSQVPTVTGLADLSAWANFDPSSTEIVIGNTFAEGNNHSGSQYTQTPNMMQHSHSNNQSHYGSAMIYGQNHQ